MGTDLALAKDLPNALNRLDGIVPDAQSNCQQIVFFLDFDGTLSPIVSNPDDARLPGTTFEVLKKLSREYNTTIVTGRALTTIKFFTSGIDDLSFAGSHGFDIDSRSFGKETIGMEHKPVLVKAKTEIGNQLEHIKEVKVEDNNLSVSVHYRHVKEEQREFVKDVVVQTCNKLGLKVHGGKLVWEVRPKTNWHKGKAVEYLLNKMMDSGMRDFTPIYIGDDTTDEDAFGVLPPFNGLSIIVFDPETAKSAMGPRMTKASLRLRNPAEVCQFLEAFVGKQVQPMNTIQHVKYSNMEVDVNEGGTQSKA